MWYSIAHTCTIQSTDTRTYRQKSFGSIDRITRQIKRPSSPHLCVLVFLPQIVFLEQSIHLRWFVDLGLRLASRWVEGQSRKLDYDAHAKHSIRTISQVNQAESELTFLAPQRRTIHSFAHRPHNKSNRLLYRDLILILLLQQTLCRPIVRAHACRLPAAIVPAWIGVVELELVMRVPAGVEDGDAEGTETTVLGVSLFEIAEALGEKLDGDGFIVGEEVALGGLSGVVDQRVGIGGQAGDAT